MADLQFDGPEVGTPCPNFRLTFYFSTISLTHITHITVMKQFIMFPALLGSDQLLPIDGRLNVSSAEQAAATYITKVQRNFPDRADAMAAEARLCTGRVANPTVIARWCVTLPPTYVLRCDGYPNFIRHGSNREYRCYFPRRHD